jgi:hypothetical protein
MLGEMTNDCMPRGVTTISQMAARYGISSNVRAFQTCRILATQGFYRLFRPVAQFGGLGNGHQISSLLSW